MSEVVDATRKDQIVTSYGKMNSGNYYQYWITGRNLSDNGQNFFWFLPDIDSDRFDWTNAVLSEKILDNTLVRFKYLIILQFDLRRIEWKE